MKARGVYVYGVWCDHCGWCKIFHPTKEFALEHRDEMRETGCINNAVRRVYIAPPKGAAK